MSQDALREYDLRDWPSLKKRLMRDWPRSVLVVRWIETRMNWSRAESNEFGVYSVGDDVESGLVTFGKTGDRVYYMTVYNFNEDLTKLKSALIDTKLIDWSQKPICGVPEELTEWFKDHLQTLKYKMYDIDNTYYYLLPPDIAKTTRIELPSDVYLARLSPEDVTTVNNLWPHRFNGSENFLKELGRLNFGLGLYSACSDELLSWGVKYEYADIGALQTKEGHQGKGYATMVVKAMILMMNCNAEHVYAFIVKGNEVSERIFKKMGFEKAGYYDWIYYE